MSEAKVFVRFVPLGREEVIREVNVIENAMKRLENLSKNNKTEDKTASYKSASYRAAIKDIEALQKQNLRWEKQVAAEIMRGDKLTADNKIREAKRSANATIKELQEIRNASAKSANDTRSIFSSVFSGSFFGGIAAQITSTLTSALSSIPSLVAELFSQASEFSQINASLAQFEGSAAAAQDRIQKLIQVAADTPGLSFKSAVEGQKRLEGIGFEGEKATQILQGISKIRVLSGSTKQDFDAVILNLTQIASGGQKVGQEIRELIGRMPGFARVIKDTFGTLSGETLNKLNPKEFVSKLADAAAGMQVNFASSALAVENFADSTDRLKIAVGGIIEQNPEVIALLRLWAQEIDGVSTALADNESQQRSAFSSFVSYLATGAVKLENFVDKVKTNFQLMVNNANTSFLNLGDFLGSAANVIFQAIKTIAYGTVAVIASTIDDTVNGIQKRVNSVVGWINDISLKIPNVPQLPIFEGISSWASEWKKSTADAFELGTFSVNTFFKNLERQQKRSLTNSQNNLKIVTDYETRVATRNLIYKNLTERERKAIEERRSATFPKSSSDDDLTATTGGKKAKQKAFKAAQDAKALIEAASQLGIAPLDLAAIISYETGGTFSTSIKGGKGGNYQGLIQFGIKERRDYGVSGSQSFERQLLDSVVPFFQDRFASVGRSTTGATLLDLYKTVNGGNPNVSSNASDGNGTIATHVQKIAAQHRNRALQRFFGGSEKNLPDTEFLSNKKISDSLSKAERDQNTRTLIETSRLLGVAPDPDVIKDYYNLLVEEAQKAKTLQPTLENVQKQFAGLDKPLTVQSNIDPLQLDAFSQKTLDQLKEFEKREKALNESRKNINTEILLSSEEYSLNLQEQLTNLQIETGVLKQRNIEIESSVEYERQRNDLSRQIGDIEKESAVFKAQQSNADFVRMRRESVAKSEALQLNKDIADLQDRIALASENSAQRYERAWLSAINEIQEANIQAVETQIQSQVKLADSATIHTDQIRAKVLSHLAEQKTINDAFADGIVSAFDKVNGILDKNLGKLGDVPILGDLLKFGNQKLTTDLTKNLLDKFFPSEFTELFNKEKNPIAAPIVEQQKTTNKLLSVIAAGSGSPASLPATLSTNPMSKILDLVGLGNITGGRTFGSGQNPNNPLIFHANGSSSGQFPVNGNPYDLLRFLTPQQNLPRPDGSPKSKGAGIYGMIGTGASLLGNLVGGRFGGILSGAGQGLALGAQIGSIVPGIGTAIGAGAGALFGLFSGDPKKKQDKKENLPALAKGISDAFAEFTALIADVKSLRTEPDSALAKGRDLRSQIASKPSRASKIIIRKMLVEIKRKAFCESLEMSDSHNVKEKQKPVYKVKCCA